MTTRFTPAEAKYYVASMMAGMCPTNATFFKCFEGVTRKRARELEGYQFDMTKEESELVRVTAQAWSTKKPEFKTPEVQRPKKKP